MFGDVRFTKSYLGKGRVESLKAALFIDYDNWLLSALQQGTRPNVEPLLKRLRTTFSLERNDISFFGDMSTREMMKEWSRLYDYSDNVFDCFDPEGHELIKYENKIITRKGRNFATAVMTDRIYRTLIDDESIEAFILCTGNRDFEFVCRHLVEKGKVVEVHCPKGTLSRALKECAEFSFEFELISAENQNDIEYDIVSNALLTNIEKMEVDNRDVYFTTLVKIVSKTVWVKEEMVREVLAGMIRKGILIQIPHPEKPAKTIRKNSNR